MARQSNQGCLGVIVLCVGIYGRMVSANCKAEAWWVIVVGVNTPEHGKAERRACVVCWHLWYQLGRRWCTHLHTTPTRVCVVHIFKHGRMCLYSNVNNPSAFDDQRHNCLCVVTHVCSKSKRICMYKATLEDGVHTCGKATRGVLSRYDSMGI